MIPTPGQPKRQYGIGGVNYHTGETVVLIRKRKRRREIAEFLQALVDKHPSGTIYVAWDNASSHEDDEVEAVVRAAAGRLVLLYLPTYSPWLNPIEMLWRHFRREVTHCDLFETVKELLNASRHFFDRYNKYLSGYCQSSVRTPLLRISVSVLRSKGLFSYQPHLQPSQGGVHLPE